MIQMRIGKKAFYGLPIEIEIWLGNRNHGSAWNSSLWTILEREHQKESTLNSRSLF